MVKERISSQHVFGYMKYILYPEDYKPKTAANNKKVVKLPEVVGKGYGTFWRWKGRYRVCKGSRASKKSKTTALWYITNMMKYPDANLLVVRKTFRTLKDSCFTELKWAIHRLGVDAHWEIKESPLEMTYKPTGQKIYFRGLDDPLKVTSITVDIGCLCWMWIEEAYEISSEDDFNMLDESIRGAIPEGSGLFKQITLTLNPWNEHHWIKKRFFDNPDDETLAMTTNYKCNEWLDKADLKVFETMRKQNPRRYKVAGLGDWGIVDGLVYENWEEKAFSIDEVKAIPGVKSVFGLDFGYTNDPSQFISMLAADFQLNVGTLENTGYKTSEYSTFMKKDGKKEREIYKLPFFPDRIAQWAILQIIEPQLLAYFTDDTYSAIPNKGIHAAFRKLRKAVDEHPEEMTFCLKIDCKKFYPSIDHDILKQKFRKKYKDPELLFLIDEIIDSIDTCPATEENIDFYVGQGKEIRIVTGNNGQEFINGVGIPIGNYFSQYAGNFYLTEFDHWMKEVKHVKHYYRYMDDICIFASSKEELHQLLQEIEEYLNNNLNLRLKGNYQIFPSFIRGVDFVGYRIFLDYTLLRKSTCQQFKQKMTAIRKKVESGQEMNYSEWCSINSYKGWLKHCDSYRLTEKYIVPIQPYADDYYKNHIKAKKKKKGGKNHAEVRKSQKYAAA